jgi:RNA polymerase sigma-70 factor (sigma-E family)
MRVVAPFSFRKATADGGAMEFEEFMAVRLPALLRYAAVLTGDRDLAQDVVQDAMVRAHARWWRIGRMDRPELYVRRMVTTQFLSWRRRGAVARTTLVDDTGRLDRALPDIAVAAVDRDDVSRLLATLPRRQRAVLVLRYYEGLTDAEIADVLGCVQGTVRGYAARALATLRASTAGRNHTEGARS